LENGEIRIGILPGGQKLLVGAARSGVIAGQSSRAGQTEPCERNEHRSGINSPVIQDLLKLARSLHLSFGAQIGESANEAVAKSLSS
jgi:hypothetical protein